FVAVPCSMLCVAFMLACSSSPQPSNGAAPGTGAASSPAKPGDDEPISATPSPYDALPADARSLLDQPFKGDLDEMVKRRLIRAAVVFNRTQYFIDKGVQRGISYESLKLFEDELNKRLKTGLLKVHVAIIPLQRDQLGAALLDGKVDLVAAAITITPERRKLADFSNPTRRDVSEIVVSGAHVPPVATADDLSGRSVFVRRGSVYLESVEKLNQSLASRGKPPVMIKPAPEVLEDDDLLEMVNAGLVDATVVDDFVARFWSQVFTNIRVNEKATVRTGGEIAVAVRKNSPKLLRAVNTWIKEYGPNTAFGNIMERRYLESTKYVKNAAADEERVKLQKMVKLFQTYGDQYKIDYLLMAAQGYQESGLDQSVKSGVGAIGVMQLMPATGKEQGVGDITQMEPNIHAGVKYFRFMMDTFYKDDPMDDLNKGLMTLASYNAGPGRIRQLRAETARRGLNPNLWFGNVERVVSERVGRETVQYVGNIYKYYVAYKLVSERAQTRDEAKDAVKKER
ncbi:MAG TPA: transporter substrate-binding domain-containing protein, partial [Vicinamibacterales bacterium]|nr:transporter substrate-binding domain-containing protein [Vicinamibacterales bacterium]